MTAPTPETAQRTAEIARRLRVPLVPEPANTNDELPRFDCMSDALFDDSVYWVK